MLTAEDMRNVDELRALILRSHENMIAAADRLNEINKRMEFGDPRKQGYDRSFYAVMDAAKALRVALDACSDRVVRGDDA